MTSQGSGVGNDILEKLSEWSSEEIENNLEFILQQLSYSHLDGQDKGLVLQSVYALLVTCLPCLPVERANESLLHHAMPAVELLFQESLEAIKLRLDDNSTQDLEDITDTVTSLLQVCIELLKCMESVLEYIVSQGRVRISSVPNVPMTVAVLMLQTFKHCKESETLYKDVFSTVADVLGAIFRQCHQLQCRFFSVVTSVISYDCSVQEDVDHLVNVLKVLSEIGEHVMRLDVKTMAEQWKGYAKIVQIYPESLRNRLNISYPINYLHMEVAKNLQQLVCQEGPKDSKCVSRILKTTSFILKIIVKFCEQFGSGSGCLEDCHFNLNQLLLTLQRYSPFALSLCDVDKSLIDEIERHLFVAADPLLSHLMCEGEFREEFFKGSFKLKLAPKDCLPHVLLFHSILKKLGSLSTENRAPWLGDSKETNVIGCLLEVLKFSHSALGGEVWLPAVVKSGQSPRTWDLYEALCCHGAALVLSCNNDQFQIIESILMDSLFKPYIWPAIFSGDVWCICARAGSSELVLDQVLFFADVVSAFESTSLKEKIECQVVSLFLRRLCSFLSAKGRQILLDRFPPANYPLMCYIIGIVNFPKDSRDSLSQKLVTNASSCIEIFLDSTCDLTNFEKMLLSLYGLCAALESGPSKLSGTCEMNTILSQIVLLWQHICRGALSKHLISSDFFPSGPKWLIQLLDILGRCTENLIPIMSNKELLQVLSQLKGVINCCNTSVRITITGILHSLATKSLEPNGQNLICSCIANLFGNLLEDKNALIKETALETFEYFAHFTAYESIVAEAVAENINLQELATVYLQKEIPVIESEENLLKQLDYLLFQQTVSCEHKCILKKPRTISLESPDKPAKRLKLECDNSVDLSDFLADDLLTEFEDKRITDNINRIAEDIKYVTTQSTFSLLPESSQKDLMKAVADLSKFVKM